MQIRQELKILIRIGILIPRNFRAQASGLRIIKRPGIVPKISTTDQNFRPQNYNQTKNSGLENFPEFLIGPNFWSRPGRFNQT